MLCRSTTIPRHSRMLFSPGLLLLLVISTLNTAQAQDEWNWQMPSNIGSAFVSAVLYFNSTVLLTGRLYPKESNTLLIETDPQCFLLELDRSDEFVDFSLQTLPRETGVFEECTDIAPLNDHVALLGRSNRPALLSQLSNSDNNAPQTAGMLLDLDGIQLPESIQGATVVGDGSLENVHPVSFATITLIGGGDSVFVVSRDSNRTHSAYQFTYHRFSRVRTSFETQRVERLRRTYATSWNNRLTSIEASNLLYLEQDNMVIVVGSTAGQGDAFGYKTVGNSNDTDGFVSKLSATTGVRYGSVHDTARVESMDETDDYIHDSCHHEGVLFIVGTFMGNNTAFLQARDIETLNVQWTLFMAGQGHACAVTPDGEEIWVAGTIDQDLWVAKSNIMGNLVFTRRMGTSEPDELGGLTTDATGNAIVAGSTNGSWLRQRSPSETASDAIVLTVSRDNGDFVLPLGTESTTPAPVVATLLPSTLQPTMSTTTQVLPSTLKPSLAPTVRDTTGTTDDPTLMPATAQATPSTLQPSSAPIGRDATATTDAPTLIPTVVADATENATSEDFAPQSNSRRQALVCTTTLSAWCTYLLFSM